MREASKGTARGRVESFRFPRVLGDWFRLRYGCGNGRPSRLFQPLNLDPRDTPSIHFHDGKSIPCIVKALSPAGNKSKLREDESSCCGVAGILRQSDVVERLEVVQA